MSTASLDAAALARKERLSQLKSLKRKQAALSTDDSGSEPAAPAASTSTTTTTTDSPPSPTSKDVSHLLSGRNYDAADRAPKMGFAHAPTENQTTLESLADQIAEQTLEARRKEEAEEKPIDLFSLQPKKPNWDLKRDVEKKLKVLEGKTDAAIARLVRQQIEEKKKESLEKDKKAGGGGGGKNGEQKETGEGVEGDLARMVREREKEAEREERDAEVDGEEDEAE